jgi:hypothetical protein
MALMQYIPFFGPPPVSDKVAALDALPSYTFLAAIVYWLEKQRAPRPVVAI